MSDGAFETAKNHVVFTREAIFQMLGKVALPPWPDQKGGYLGGDLDCAVIASELIEAVEEYRVKTAGLLIIEADPVAP